MSETREHFIAMDKSGTIRHWILIGLLVFGVNSCSRPPSELDRKWPDYQVLRRIGDRRYDYMTAPVREGYVLTRKKDTLRGYVKIANFNHGRMKVFSLLPFDKTKESDIINVPLEDIDYIQVQLPEGHDSVRYGIVEGSTCRILGERGDVRIYYDPYWTEDIDGNVWTWNRTLLVSPGSVKIMPFLHNNPSAGYSLLRYINYTYGKHFIRKDFGSQNEMVDYILEREAK